ncbi:MAG: hypothetical protein LWY06_04950 [Firmicutes bacterium]|nr:hypothetical protein [Bacillota bacterium]
MAKLTAESMIKYYWSSIVGTAKSIDFAKHLKEEKFVRFEEIIDEFRNKFSDEWIKSDKFKNREFDVILMF